MMDAASPDNSSQEDTGLPTDHTEPPHLTPKDELLASIQKGLADGVVTDEEVLGLLLVPGPNGLVQPTKAMLQPAPVVHTEVQTASNVKLSAVEVMFYIAGLVLFGAIVSALWLSWETNNSVSRIGLSAGLGFALWIGAYFLNRRQAAGDIRKGLENAMIVTGGLSVITGGFIISMELQGGDAAGWSGLSVALTVAALSVVFFLYDRFVRKDLIAMLGVLLGVAAFPSVMGWILAQNGAGPDIWALVSLASIGLLFYASRLLGRLKPDRPVLKHPFDGICSFLALGTMFAANFTNFGVLWLFAMFLSVLALFYVSIINLNKQSLGTASFFLVVGVLTVAFKYFSGGGITMSLIVATIGLLASGAVASSINKKYFKPATQ